MAVRHRLSGRVGRRGTRAAAAAAAAAGAAAGSQSSRRVLQATFWAPAVLALCIAVLAYRAAGQLRPSLLAGRAPAPAPPPPPPQQQQRTKSTFKPNDPPLTIPCGCSDVDPRDSFLRAKVDFSCFDQSRFGTCKEAFMLQTPEEVPEGYCQISCGRCSCCPTLDSVLKAKGLDMFRWMLSFSDEGQKTQMPGYMVTLLAPTDTAVWSALNRLGYKSKEDVEKDGKAKGIIADIGRYHVLTPVEPMKATWTAPFMRSDVQMYTAISGGKTVSARQDGGGRISVVSPKSSANVVERDLYACKGWVQVIDAVLIPWSMTGYA